MKYLEKIQTLLPLGYLYLIVLGLLKETLYFYPLGINILNYSSITDILISPISTITKSMVVVIAVLSLFILLFVGQQLVINNSHKSWAQFFSGNNKFDVNTSKADKRKTLLPALAALMGFVLLTFFVGIGLGSGMKLSKSIIQNKYTYNRRMTFSSGKIEDVYVFDQNSTYYFYVTKGNRNIKIAPVSSINSMELINNITLR